MPNTYTQLYIQIVFTVKGRKSLIKKPWRDDLYKYICGIVNNKSQKVYAIGGVEDHIHILVSVFPNISISELVGLIKSNSSRWINQNGLVPQGFQWQEGFGAFSYSQSDISNVANYIANQETHHAKRKFRDEYIDLLEKFNVAYDEKYLFEWLN